MNRKQLALIMMVMLAVRSGFLRADETYEDGSGSTVLVYSAELNGELTPCKTCGKTQLGGLARRAQYFNSELGKCAGYLAVEGGDLCAREKGDDSTIKFQVIVSALDAMGYSAVGLGERDLALGADFLETMVGRTSVALLCGNAVTLDGRHLFPTYTTVQVPLGETTATIAVLGLVGEFEGYMKPDVRDVFSIEDPVPAARAAMSELETQTDMQVLMYHGTEQGAQKLVGECPSIDLVLITPHTLAPQEALPDGDEPVRLVTGGREGNHLGIIMLERASSGAVRASTFRSERMSEDIPDDPLIMGLIGSYERTLVLKSMRENMLAQPSR